jgi:hypothetical protein
MINNWSRHQFHLHLEVRRDNTHTPSLFKHCSNQQKTKIAANDKLLGLTHVWSGIIQTDCTTKFTGRYSLAECTFPFTKITGRYSLAISTFPFSKFLQRISKRVSIPKRLVQLDEQFLDCETLEHDPHYWSGRSPKIRQKTLKHQLCTRVVSFTSVLFCTVELYPIPGDFHLWCVQGKFSFLGAMRKCWCFFLSVLLSRGLFIACYFKSDWFV